MHLRRAFALTSLVSSAILTACVASDEQPPITLALPDGAAIEAPDAARPDAARLDAGSAPDAPIIDDAAPDAGSSNDAASEGSVPDAAIDGGPSGVLDVTFASVGYVTRTASAGGSFDRAAAIAIDSQGRVLVAGSAQASPGNKAAVWRFTSSGATDTGFGANGVWLKNGTFVSSNYDGAYGIAVDAQDRPVITGQSNNGSPIYMATWRLDTAGALDTTFGSPNGFYGATNTLGTGGYDTGNTIAIDSSGRILVAGFSTVSSSHLDLCVWRHSSAGAADTAGFGAPNGYFSESQAAGPTANPFDNAAAMAIDANGRLVMVGTSYTGTTSVGLVVRATSAGAIDTSLNATGKRVLVSVAGGTGANAYDALSGVAVDAQNRITVAGTSQDASNDYKVFVARLTEAGALDASFGTNGVTFLASPGGGKLTFGGALAVDSKGRVVVVGGGGPSLAKQTLAVWRVDGNGAIDTSFGNGGLFSMTGTAGAPLTADAGPTASDNGATIAIDALDRPVIAGSSVAADGKTAIAVWRLTP